MSVEQSRAAKERNAEARTAAPVDVSIIIVSWNVAELLKGCIQSIVEYSSGLSLEVIVVDNASMDHTLSMLAEEFRWVRVIGNKENVGFACANNQGFRRAEGKYVFILNPDTVLVNGALRRMVEFLDRNPTVALVGPKICRGNGETQASCARLLPTLSWSFFCDTLQLFKLPLIGSWFSHKYFSPYDYSITQEIEAASGAAMLVRNEVIQKLGGFGDSFLHCGEDVDLCFRLRQAGWKIYYLSDAMIVHYSGQSNR